jgi:hypothetical protein
MYTFSKVSLSGGCFLACVACKEKSDYFCFFDFSEEWLKTKEEIVKETGKKKEVTP